MQALIVAAGYATRLYPLTKDFPKPLLEVGRQTILDHLLDQLEAIPEIDRVFIVTNHRFAGHFEKWRVARVTRLPIEVLDDGTSSNETRLGAVGDLAFALRTRQIDDDLLVAAADNIFQFSLADFAATFRARRATHICARHVEEIAARRRTGIVVLDRENRVVEFAEKPPEPKSAWGVPPLYIYPRETLPRIAEYLAGGGNPDAPGHFIEWLHRVAPVYAHKVEGPAVLDIGNLDSLEAARRLLG